MKKKIFIFSSVIFITILSIFYLSSFIGTKNTSCPFCNEKIINYQKYFENEKLLGLYNYKPLIKGHCLIIPKRHVQRFEDLTEVEIAEVFKLIKKTNQAMQKIIDIKSYLILQKNGRSVGQTVDHLHFHYMPNKLNGSKSAFFFRFVLYPFFKKLDENEMKKMTSQISENLSHKVNTF